MVDSATIVFVGGTCRSIHFESFNKNIKAFGVLESKWDPRASERERERERDLYRLGIIHNGGSRAAPAHGLRITTP